MAIMEVELETTSDLLVNIARIPTTTMAQVGMSPACLSLPEMFSGRLTGPYGLSACVLLRVAARNIEQPTSKFNYISFFFEAFSAFSGPSTCKM